MLNLYLRSMVMSVIYLYRSDNDTLAMYSIWVSLLVSVIDSGELVLHYQP